MERKVYVVRHAVVENPHKVLYGRLPGFHLSREGEANIYELAEKIKASGTKFSRIYTSPLERTRETAKILSNVLGVPTEPNDALLEVKCKLLEGKNRLQQLRLYLLHGIDIYSDYYTQRGVEPANVIMNRMQKFIQAKLEQTEGNFMVVSHGDPINLLIWSYVHRDRDFRKSFYLRKFENYPKKGQAMVLVFDQDVKFLRLVWQKRWF